MIIFLIMFGCKIFIHFNLNGVSCYEERVVAVRANSFSEAVQIAEDEARAYADSVDGKYVNYVQCYKAKEWNDDKVVSEIYSLIRESDLDFDAYIDRFEDTGKERSKWLDEA